MTLEHTPPQLSPDGERLLAAVLAARLVDSEAAAHEPIGDAVSGDVVPEPSTAPSAPIHPMTVLVPVLVVMGGLLAAFAISMGLAGKSNEAGNVDVEVAGVVEERLDLVGSVEISLLSIESSNDTVRRFDVRIGAGDLAVPVAADRFDIGVVDHVGNPVTTIVRFPSGDLEPSSYIDAMVRTEGAGSAGHIVSVLLDGVMIERLPLD